MTDKPSNQDQKQHDRFWWLDLPDLMTAIDAAVRVTWLILRALWWLAGLAFKKGAD